MSDKSDPRTAPSSVPLVGYGRPPIEHRFKKGVSGNRFGRPKKQRKDQSAPQALSVADLVIAEALRPISIRENGDVLVMSTIQGVLRSLNVSAVKGNHRAQIAVTGLYQAAVQRKLDDRQAMLDATIAYRNLCLENFAECDREGRPRPEPVPHPDEIDFDARTGEIIFNGPQNDREKAQWDELLARKAEAVDAIAHYRRELKRSKPEKELLEGEIEAEQRIVRMIDCAIPDEKTRRSAGFNLREWREEKRRIQEILGEATGK